MPGGEAAVQALLEVSFDRFHALSLKALRRIVPLMEQGMRYDEAVAAIPEYGHHSQLHLPGADRQKYLPPFYEQQRGKDKDRNRMLFNEQVGNEIPGGIPRNPVVLRALNQARKVVNAIIRKYGAPQSVHIEMARDLSRPLDERRSIENEQKEYRERNGKKDKAHFAEQFGRMPSGAEFEKYRALPRATGKMRLFHRADFYRAPARTRLCRNRPCLALFAQLRRQQEQQSAGIGQGKSGQRQPDTLRISRWRKQQSTLASLCRPCGR